MAAQQSNLCVYRKGHCLWRNTGPYCKALSLRVMSSVKRAAGEDRGILSLSFPDCAALNFTESKHFFTVEWNIHRQGAQSSEGALCIQDSRTVFVCVQCKTSVSSGFRCDLPVPVRGVAVVFGTGLGYEELTESVAGLPFARGRERHSPVMAVVLRG